MRAAGGIEHMYQEFDGTHSGIDYRMDVSLPFPYKALKPQQGLGEPENLRAAKVPQYSDEHLFIKTRRGLNGLEYLARRATTVRQLQNRQCDLWQQW